MTKTYDLLGSGLILKEGDIADFKGGGVVVPCYTDFSTGNAIFDSITEKLQKDINWPEEKRIGVNEAVPINVSEEDGVDFDYIIMSAVYGLHNVYNEAKENDIRQATKEILTIANFQKIESIAFPFSTAGWYGNPLEMVVTTMVHEIIEFNKEKGELPKSVTLYALESAFYKRAEKIIDEVIKKKS